ncbi:hypothetical protein DFR55_11940 [Herbinix hemicellulosilytica]|uniref:Uncharacterized protein n=1 Tax=Herbinix hemicellulosilytica TaxID=1564487 RepID=A0A0H5SSW6_HERHM|nr:DUF6514 family protein [Herbinix hemicellulosilytica]RBP57770.1 hypothetical protein DFR55_11940 [Herbinix hemicellulosilytica]CRZ33398.1 hypothetical protein HHT355_0184 [Herbinix hemicellulosilytica]
MKKMSLLFSNEVTLEDNRIMRLEYNITENRSSDTDEPYYGILIAKYLDGSKEVEEIEGISYSRDKVEAIAKILHRNTVTPISMVEIVDDLITLEAV